MLQLIGIYLSFIFAIGILAIELWYVFKCRGKKECFNRNCLYAKFFDCYRYHYRGNITEEEAKELLEYLDRLIPETKEDESEET